MIGSLLSARLLPVETDSARKGSIGYDLRREFDVRFDDATVDEPGRHYGLVVVI